MAAHQPPGGGQRQTGTFSTAGAGPAPDKKRETVANLRLPFSPQQEEEWKANSYFWYELVEKYNPIYRLAGFRQYLICIPNDDSLPSDVTCLPYAVLKAHILRPANAAAVRVATEQPWGRRPADGAGADADAGVGSAPAQFTSLLGDHHTVELRGSALVSRHRQDGVGPAEELEARVVRPEAMVNADGQVFWVYFLDQSLVPVRTDRDARRASLRVEQRRQTLGEFRDFLYSHRTAHEAAANLDTEVEIFNVSYVCMPNYEELLVAKVNQAFETATDEFAAAIPLGPEHPRYYTLQLAVHSHLLSGIHAKVWAHWASMFVEEDAQFVSYCDCLARTLGMQELGIDPELQVDQSSSVECLRGIDDRTNPYEKLYCIKETMERIAENVPAGLRDGLSADVMLPLLIWVIVRAHPPHVDTTVNYLSVFQFPELAAGQLGYAFASFEAAVFFIRQEAIRREEEAAERNAHAIGAPSDVRLVAHFSSESTAEEIRAFFLEADLRPVTL